MGSVRQAGCTLIEALVTLALLSFAMSALVRLQLDLLQATGLGKARSEALALAEARLEDLRTITQDAPYGEGPGALLDIAGSNGLFDLHWSIGPTSGGALYALEVRVRWTDAKGVQRELGLAGLAPAGDPARVGRVFD